MFLAWELPCHFGGPFGASLRGRLPVGVLGLQTGLNTNCSDVKSPQPVVTSKTCCHDCLFLDRQGGKGNRMWVVFSDAPEQPAVASHSGFEAQERTQFASSGKSPQPVVTRKSTTKSRTSFFLEAEQSRAERSGTELSRALHNTRRASSQAT